MTANLTKCLPDKNDLSVSLSMTTKKRQKRKKEIVIMMEGVEEEREVQRKRHQACLYIFHL